MRIKLNDIVKVTTGNDAGSTGKVLSVDHAAGKLVVEGMNLVKKHVRRSQRNPQGGQLKKEMPIRISNVMLVCPLCSQPTRTGARVAKNGAKERFCKKCSASISVIAPPRDKK